MRNYLAVAGLIVLALLARPSAAADYYWYSSVYASAVGTHPSPQSLCDAISNLNLGGNLRHGYSRYSIDETGRRGSCFFEKTDGSQHPTVPTIVRAGDSCPAGTTYIPGVGACIGDEQCSGQKGQSFPFSRSGQAGDGELIWNIGVGGTSGNNWSLNSQDACNNGCAATVTRSKCAVRVSGSYVCGGTAEYTGSACPASTSGPVQTEPSESLPEPKTDQVNQPCIYETLPDGTQRCRSVKATDAEGQICGEFNGSRVCTSRQPKTDGTTIDTTVKTETNPDGSKTITKTDTATKEVCVGAGACSSTTTTTTTTTHVDANGNKTGESSTCTGSACPSPGNPDGDGDGIGDCTGDDCGEGGVPGLDDVPGFGDALRGYLDGVSDAPIVKALNGIGLSGQGTCHFPSVTVAYLGTLSFDVICHHAGWLDPLYPLMLAVYAFLAIRLFFTA